MSERINELVGVDTDGKPGDAVIVFKDRQGNEYGVWLTHEALQRTIILCIQAHSLLSEREQQPQVGSRIEGYPKYSLSDCTVKRVSDGESFLALQLDGFIRIALPLSEQEGLLMVEKIQEMTAQNKGRGFSPTSN